MVGPSDSLIEVYNLQQKCSDEYSYTEWNVIAGHWQSHRAGEDATQGYLPTGFERQDGAAITEYSLGSLQISLLVVAYLFSVLSHHSQSNGIVVL
jgi:hypothetical protein